MVKNNVLRKRRKENSSKETVGFVFMFVVLRKIGPEVFLVDNLEL